jgi:hypothetical protein
LATAALLDLACESIPRKRIASMLSCHRLERPIQMPRIDSDQNGEREKESA